MNSIEYLSRGAALIAKHNENPDFNKGAALMVKHMEKSDFNEFNKNSLSQIKEPQKYTSPHLV